MIYHIGVKGTSRTIEIDSTRPSDEICAYIFQKGLDSIMGRGRSKLGKPETFASKEAYENECYAIALKQVEDLYEGRTLIVGGAKKAKGADAAVQAEMLNVARRYAKEQVRTTRKDVKISKISAAEWTRTAKAYIEANPEYFRKVAEENLSKAAGITPDVAIDLSFIKEDPRKVAAAEKAKANKAKSAAKIADPVVPVKGKGKPQPAARH